VSIISVEANGWPVTDGLGARRDGWRRLVRNPMAMVGGVVVVLLVAVAILADVIAPHNPTRQNYDALFQPPGGQYLLGTDNLGRDQLSRLVHGSRVALAVGVLSQAVVLVLGVSIGSLAALAGGWVDNLLMRLTDVVYAFPDLLLIILLSTALREHPLREVGGGLPIIFLAIGLANWVGVARLARGQLLALREREFVEAARALGAGNGRILLVHLLPNAVGPLIVAATFGIPSAIFAEATLSFLGLGIVPPNPSWGSMIQEGYQAIFAYPHLVLFPALAIATTLLGFTFLGDGLRDALDPRCSTNRSAAG